MMGCFLPCFGACKRPRKQTHSTNPTSSGDQIHVADRAPKSAEPTEVKIVEKPGTCIEISKINLEVKSDSYSEKKVNSDFNSNTNEELPGKGLLKRLEEASKRQDKASEEETPQLSEHPKSMASNKSSNSNTSHCRYGVCSEDEEDGEADQNMLQEESSGSLFSLSIDCKKPASAAQKAENEVNSPMPLPATVCYDTKSEKHESGQSTGDSVSTVLNPIENLCEDEGIQALKEGVVESINTSKTKLELEEKPNCVARKVSFDLSVNTNEELSTKELFNEVTALSKPFNFSVYRYRDYCEEEYDDINLKESNLDDPENDKKGEDEATWTESSESLFSVSIGSRKQVFATEKEKDDENEVNSSILKEKEAIWSTKITPGRDDGIQHVTSVLNPIENLMKPNVMRPSKKEEEKENIYIPITAPEPSLKLSNRKSRQKFNVEKEIGVDTSLSSWLVQEEVSTPKSKSGGNGTIGETTPPKGARGSPASHEDRPILGALTIEDLSKFSASTSPRRPRSRSRSPKEMPIIGTVGSYWSHTAQTMDYPDSNARNRSRELQGAELKWNSTPFRARLQKAFN
ncbi:hypothetical protein L6164_035190 [Bauhinia variegata]|uniref:Uncharacterized protein n=1 Tax=Bauhinia variegata TaxID=167791 RepID=A0ACB9KWU7_BAUVA|nr:hypothetical protein L6164_035190 [Bauhinia variegata]